MAEFHVLLYNLMISTDISTTQSTKNIVHTENKQDIIKYTGSTPGVRQAARLIIWIRHSQGKTAYAYSETGEQASKFHYCQVLSVARLHSPTQIYKTFTY